ncbi:MAG: hypothetical protein HY362_02315 [Candidatus Aenigmarchaeota archaeon]|nr:hypothetical protein [Candidatus Aenigmarchaeota archaeon]
MIKKLLGSTVLVSIIILIFYIYLNLQTESSGYWKPDKAEQAKQLETLKQIYTERNNWSASIGLTDHEIPRRVISADYKRIYDRELLKIIDEKTAIKMATDIMQNNHSYFGVPKDLKMKNEVRNIGFGTWVITYEPQTYKDLQICNAQDSGGMSIDADGVITDIGFVWYPNLTAPTRPKLTDEQIGKIVGAPLGWLHDGKLCIFPKWHPEGEYWTYHLAKDYGGPIIDTWTGETLKEPRPPIID